MIGQGFYFIGEPELLAGFRLAGAQGQVALTPREVREAFAEACRQDQLVVIFSQTAAGLLRSELQAWQSQGNYPLVVEVPDLDGSGPMGQGLVELIREAIGIRV